MLKEFIDTIGALAVNASVPNELHPDAEPEHVYWLIDNEDGSLKRHEADPAPRNHSASSLDAILQYINSATTPSTIWFNREKVVGVLDDTTRRDILTLELQASPQLISLQEIKKETRFTQEALIRFLRISMAGCQADTTIIAQLRKINWKMAKDSSSEISRNKTSLGKTIEAQALGIEQLPEETQLLVPIFANLYVAPQVIRCAIEPDLAKENFEFLPFPGEIENAIQRAEALIGDMLRHGLLPSEGEESSRDVKVCYGQP